MASLTGIDGFTSFVFAHHELGAIMVAILAALGVLVVAVCRSDPGRRPFSPLERFIALSTGLIGVALMVSPTYYYHYSGFIAPFAAILVTCVGVRFVGAARRRLSMRQLDSSPRLVWVAALLPVAFLLVAATRMVATLPAAAQVSDPVNDAIPASGCVLYANPTVGLLDNRFTSDVSGCPNVIDWNGQERVLDNGLATSNSDRSNRLLQSTMSHWIESSDAVVLGTSNLELDTANEHYLNGHFSKESSIPAGVRIYVKHSRAHRQPAER